MRQILIIALVSTLIIAGGLYLIPDNTEGARSYIGMGQGSRPGYGPSNANIDYITLPPPSQWTLGANANAVGTYGIKLAGKKEYIFETDEGLTLLDSNVAEAFGNSAGYMRTHQGRLDFVTLPSDNKARARADFGAGALTGAMYIEGVYSSTTYSASPLSLAFALTDKDANTAEIITAGLSNSIGILLQNNVLQARCVNGASSTTSTVITIPATVASNNAPVVIALSQASSGLLTLNAWESKRKTTAWGPQTLACNAIGRRWLHVAGADERSTLTGRSHTFWVDDVVFATGRTTKYPTTKQTITSPWVDIQGKTLHATTPFVATEKLIGQRNGEQTANCTVTYQYATNDGALNGASLTQAQVNTALAGQAYNNIQIAVELTSSDGISACDVSGIYLQ